MFICNVVCGNTHVVGDIFDPNQLVSSPPPGHDSVSGLPLVTKNLNFDEVAVYERHHILPRYLMVYTTDAAVHIPELLPPIAPAMAPPPSRKRSVEAAGPASAGGGGGGGSSGFTGLKCARPNCPCTATWNGMPGEHCCMTCRGGKPCGQDYHGAAPQWPSLTATISSSSSSSSGAGGGGVATNKCARPECPCTATWNGKQGEYCSLTCRRGKACREDYHGSVKPSASSGSAMDVVVGAGGGGGAGLGPKCARPECPCTATWNGAPGEHCCHTCRLGRACAADYHGQAQYFSSTPSVRSDVSSVSSASAGGGIGSGAVSARCVATTCPCTSTWNGLPGEHCCLTCKRGRPCHANYHRAPGNHVHHCGIRLRPTHCEWEDATGHARTSV